MSGGCVVRIEKHVEKKVAASSGSLAACAHPRTGSKRPCAVKDRWLSAAAVWQAAGACAVGRKGSRCQCKPSPGAADTRTRYVKARQSKCAAQRPATHRAASSMCTHLKSQKVGKVAGVVGTSLERDVMIAPRSTIRASQDAFHFLLEAVGVAIALVLHTHTMRNRCQGCVCRCAFSLSSKHECRPDPRRRMASSRRRRCPSVCIGYGSACRPYIYYNECGENPAAPSDRRLRRVAGVKTACVWLGYVCKCVYLERA